MARTESVSKMLIPDDLRDVVSAMAHSAIHNYGIPGLSSSLVGGGKRGMIRLFKSDRETQHHITPHSHRFDFLCLVLKGWAENEIYSSPKYGESGDKFIRSTLMPIEGGLGKYGASPEVKPVEFVVSRTRYEEGETYCMRAREIHSIRFSRDAQILFFEGPQVQASTVILEPYSNGQHIKTFKVEDWMFTRKEEGACL